MGCATQYKQITQESRIRIKPFVIKTALSSDLFLYNNGVFIADASSLTGYNWFCQIYHDAVEAGFAIVNPKTNGVMVFSLSHTHRQEGEIVKWEFNVVQEYVQQRPDLSHLQVVIFND